MAGSLQAVFQNQRSFGAPPGSQSYTTPGTYTWVAPAGVTKVSVVAVGAGQGGSGGTTDAGSGAGGLGWKNNISVVSGNSYTVVVGNNPAGGCSPGASYFINSTTVAGNGGVCHAGGTYVGCGGGNGGNGSSGGGGAGGYSGAGGTGGGYYGGAAGCGGVVAGVEPL